MFFPKVNLRTEQLEFMIQSILLEYGEQEESNMAALLAKNYRVNEEDILSALQAYSLLKEEDYEMLSNKQLQYGKL